MSGEVTWRELTSQPGAWAPLLARLESGALALPEGLAGADDYLLLGSGSSYYLALAIADWMRRRGLDARAVPSCEVLLDPWETRPSARRRVAIGISRSGSSTELILASRRLSAAGFTTCGITCTAGSDLLKEADLGLLIPEGHEDGLVMLRSFSTMLIAAQWLFGGPGDRTALRALPAAGQHMLRQGDALGRLAQAPFDRFVFLGSGPAYPLAREAALKVQEMSVATSEAYHSLDYRHGPKTCADARTAVVLFALSDRDHGVSLARDVKALGASLIVVGADAPAYGAVADLCLAPGAMTDDAAAAAALLLPVQVFAHATALRRGRDPDAPANLSKVVLF